MTPTAPLLRSEEVCATLGIDRSTLTRWVAAGKASPAMKLPGPRGAYLFAPDEVERLEALWANRRTEATA